MQSSNPPIKYVHEGDAHNLQSPSIIVPYLMDKLNPATVIDVGCGIGTFLHVFKQHGVKEVLGIDGSWVNRKQLYISEEEFREVNLEEPIQLSKTYDLVICLEVAEHLAPSAADVLTESLCSLGKKIVFSAATSKQGGQNHTNEQPFQYWKKKFEAKGYKIIDLFRPYFWNEERIQWWYKQNMFLIVHQSIDTNDLEISKHNFSADDLLIHPELYYERIRDYEQKSTDLHQYASGEKGNFNFYLGLLYRKFLKSFRRQN